jgi:hypothetical protein
MASFEGKPITDNHPPGDVDLSNYDLYQRGHLQNVRRGSHDLQDYLIADLLVTNPNLINDIENKVKREVSGGYVCTYEVLADGKLVQRQIRGNHVAVVPQGRAGRHVAIQDSQLAVPEPTPKRRTSMPKKKLTVLDRIARTFLRQAKDAEPEDIEQLAEELVEEITESAPAAADQEPNPDAPGDLAVIQEALAPVLQAIEALGQRITALEEAKAAPAPAADEETDPVEALIQELEGATAEGDPPADQEEAVTVPAEEMNEETEDCAAQDAAKRKFLLDALKAAKPAIAAITDKGERKRVADAFLAAVRPQIKQQDTGGVKAILDITKHVGQQRATDAQPTDVVGTQQAAYNKRNPHAKR